MDKERERFLGGFTFFQKGGRQIVLDHRGIRAEIAGYLAAKGGSVDAEAAADAYQRSTALVQRPRVEIDENGFIINA